MATFMQSLADNPSGSVGAYNNTPNKPIDYAGPLSIVNQLRDRELRDFEHKANFMSDLTMRQNRMQSLFDPNKQAKPEMNTVMAADPNQLTAYQKGELGIRQRANDIDSQRLDQSNMFGQQNMELKDRQQQLNETKNEQINTAKQAEMQRKIDDSNARIEMAQKALDSKNTNAEAQLQAHKDLAAAVEERHKLELLNKQNEFDVTSKQHQEQIDALKKQIEQNANTTATTELSPDGTKKTVTTTKGKTVAVVGKDGKTYNIPADKVDDWNQNHKGQ